MPRTAGTSTPSYRQHRATGQAIVTISGHDRYLGQYGTKASKAEYRRLINEWKAAGRPNTAATVNDITIGELLDRYRKWAEKRYRRDGIPTGEAANLGLAMRPLRELYGATRAIDFRPLALKAIQQHMIEADLCRNTVNSRIHKIKRMFRWAVSEDLLPPAVRDAVSAVEWVEGGRDGVRETEEVQPVDDAVVEATLPWLPVVVADMAKLQRLTGCRPGEVCQLRPCDVDTTGEVWVFRPARHKTKHRGHERVIHIGPKAQAVLRSYLLRAHDARCFQPSDSERKRAEALRESRRTKVQPSQQNRRKPTRKRQPGDAYCSRAYQHAVGRAIRRANRARLKEAAQQGIDANEVELLPHWHPHQLRHTAATELWASCGLDATAITLGHRDLRTALRYAKQDRSKAADAMAKIG